TGRAELLRWLGREALLAGLAIVADVAEGERGDEQSRWVDDMVNELAATLFVVGPSPWPAHGLSVFRVATPSRGEQRQLWRAALGERASQFESAIDSVVEQFDLGASAIVRIAERMGAAGANGFSLWQACREHNGVVLGDLAYRIVPRYDWEDIVVSAEV